MKKLELDGEQLEDVTGGRWPLTVALRQHVYCAVDPKHRWPIGFDACPVCGSTEYIVQTD